MGNRKVLIYCKDCKTIFANNPLGCPWCINKDLRTANTELQTMLEKTEDDLASTGEEDGITIARLTEELATLKADFIEVDKGFICSVKLLNETKAKLSKLQGAEKDATAMNMCIDDALIVMADYDGYKDTDGLKKLIDRVTTLLTSKYPERLYNEIKGEVCPLCHESTTTPVCETAGDRRTLRRIEGVLKMWASVINPDYKKIYVEIQQALMGN